jgi:hypothetical protein
VVTQFVEEHDIDIFELPPFGECECEDEKEDDDDEVQITEQSGYFQDGSGSSRKKGLCLWRFIP